MKWQQHARICLIAGALVAGLSAFTATAHLGKAGASTRPSKQYSIEEFPGLHRRTKVSAAGGVHPTWAPTGRGAREQRLFYVSLDAGIWVVPYQTIADAFVPEKPRLWAPAGVVLPRARSLDLHPDGKRFAALRGTSAPDREHLSLMMDAFGEVRRMLQTPAR